MLAYKYRYESLIRQLGNYDLCTKFSCYHCHRKTCIVREDAKKKVAEYMTNSGKEET